ncbi:uncharacterized protein LOC113273280 [Papaver somniferum]|uniref:uncharacterized protein LOC113273280 n=1 Tax=Papaver somniferum TaxID=3469 RepID=UPI000E704D26|nr:uncharacterized protein LOC113273280 [Papaver somniferum]
MEEKSATKEKPTPVPFDICNYSSKEDSVVDPIQHNVLPSNSGEEVLLQQSKFSPLEIVESAEVPAEIIKEVSSPKIVSTPNVVSTPKVVSTPNMISSLKKVTEVEETSNMIPFVDGLNGTVVNTLVQVTYWAKVVEKEMVNTSASTSDAKSPPDQPKLISDLNKPWIILGDFNAVISQDEKVGGRPPNRTAMLDFNEYRVLFNQKWLQLYGDWGYKVGMRIVSDHTPLLGGCASIPKPKNIPRKFQKMWISHPKFLEVVSECWEKTITGDPAFQFLHKLKELKKVLNEWNWKVFGNVQVKIKESEERVKAATDISDNNPFDEDALNELVKSQNEHASREVQENTLLRQKSRVKWIKEGTTNIIFSHTNMKIRNARNTVNEIEDDDGNVLASQDLIAQYLVNEDDQRMLDVIPEEEDIKKIIFEMDPESTRGPDGFSGIFYRSCWEILKQDLVESIQYCWRRKFISKGMNSSFLFLLPKTQVAKTANHFRPIGLSNVIFKIFTNIITSKMSELMKKVISPQQVAYFKGRSIHENVILASELVNEMKFKRRGVNVSMKLDISQDYDTVSWVIKVLTKYGFSNNWCEWIITLFKSARIYVLVNGGPCGFFKVERGLRQGDPLSPILFVIMEDVLSRNI